MQYALTTIAPAAKKTSAFGALKKLWPYVQFEKKNLILASVAIVVTSGINLLVPFLVGHTIDTYIQSKVFVGVVQYAIFIGILSIVAFISSYYQTILVGSIGRRLLYALRNDVFKKLQSLPIDFFNQNKAGDLISRINNDTDKVNQFFSQALMRFIGNGFMILGAGILLLVLNVQLGSVALLPAIALLIITQTTSSWIRSKNARSMQALGGMSSEIQESLANFKAVVVFHRRDYFETQFNQANETNFKTSVRAGIANTIFTPIYAFCSNMAQLIVLLFGMHLITTGSLTIGILISYIVYVSKFYDPLREMASIWSSFQSAMAGFDRIAAILAMESNLPLLPAAPAMPNAPVLECKNVSFGYTKDTVIIHKVNLVCEQGKTYALVGPTGGGKTTLASLLARLYDPLSGEIIVHGRDIRTYTDEERTNTIGFILQEPFLFSGTIKDNVLYGNEKYNGISTAELLSTLTKHNLEKLVERFPGGLETVIQGNDGTISLGQKQLIAFMRAVLKEPDILILDEATANIDTITEVLLTEILAKLPAHTVRIIIAHRLNTIKSADDIYFVNNGTVTHAGTFEHALELLKNQTRVS